ncbi:MAG: PEP-CTERM sorting domain-containing protein [Bythopirellula sp.]|nr:PEP-CTERM sorting domain-containing protein [Bythopirellula sp.]
MKRQLILFLAMGFVVGTSSANGQVVIIGGALNNGYLDDAVAVQNTTGANPTTFIPQPASWTYVGTTTIFGPFVDGVTVESFANGSPTPQTTGALGDPARPNGCSNNPATADCGAFFKAFAGTTVRGPITVDLYQDHPATPGKKYTLTGWAGGGPGHLAAGHELALEFLDAGGSIIPLSGDINPMTALLLDNGLPFDYKEYMAMAIAPANAAEVRARVSMIAGMNNPAGGDQAFVVDDITLTCIPEPSSLVMAGLSLIGMCSMRRRS